MLFLKEANYEDIEKEYLFVRDMPFDENGFTNEWHGIAREDFEKQALKAMIAYSKGEGLPEGYVPETFLFLWNDNEIVGQFRIRHFLCESLREGAGHIGYFIQKEYREKGYGTEGLRLALQVAKNIIPEDEIYLRVNKDNPASLRVMINNGGYIDHEDESKYYVRIRKYGDFPMFNDTSDLKDTEIFLKLDRTCDAQPEKKWLPAYYFEICLLSGEKIGYCDLRIGHNEKTYIGGNIGYGIDEPYRGHHYAAKACKLLFQQAKKHGLDYVIITCVPENIASARTCELAGGEFIEIADIPESNEMYEEGKRRVRIYKFAI